ncbi:GNAT family N-acetyltransferase [Haladaptatus sp. DYF46]|uniref:GNAT family N-acetyltransferase n=1 Tax=Haladaptatus sp. DYF46 TaxID=2886041 RepID=UPI0031844B10
MTVRPAIPADRLTVLRIVNGAMLEIDADEVEDRIETGDVLVAEEDGRLLGAAVLDGEDRPTHIDAIAVLRARRGQGIGSELVAAAAEREGVLTADFAPRVRPFYESLGFDIEEMGERDGRKMNGEGEGGGEEEKEGEGGGEEEKEGEEGRLWGRLDDEVSHRIDSHSTSK